MIRIFRLGCDTGPSATLSPPASDGSLLRDGLLRGRLLGSNRALRRPEPVAFADHVFEDRPIDAALEPNADPAARTDVRRHEIPIGVDRLEHLARVRRA